MAGDTEGEASSSLRGEPTTELSLNGMWLCKMSGLRKLLILKQIQIYSFSQSMRQGLPRTSGLTVIYQKRRIKEKQLRR